MNLTVILAAVLALSGLGGRESVCHISGSEPVQSAPNETPQPPATDPAKVSGDAKQPAAETEKQTPPEKKAEEPGSQKPASSQPATSAPNRRSRKKKAAPLTPEGEPRKVVIHQGGANEPTAQILPGITMEEANRQRESSEQLLAASESSLAKLADRPLSPRQQQMVVQIRQYVQGSRSALKESDTQRAHTLALKAYLLADDLVKHEK
jgi:hypothetical protein